MYDLTIIGAGPAGLSAGLFAGMYGLKTTIVGEMLGGQLNFAPMVFDYPGVRSITGKDWLTAMYDRLKESSVEVRAEKIVDVSSQKEETGEVEKTVFTSRSPTNEYKSLSLLFASGNEKRRPSYTGNDLARSLGVEITPTGFMYVDSRLATNIEGVFAAGDCLPHPPSLEQLVTSAAFGVEAAAFAYTYIKHRKPPILWGKASIPRT